MRITKKPVIQIPPNAPEELQKSFPENIISETIFDINIFRYAYYKFLLILVNVTVRIRLGILIFKHKKYSTLKDLHNKEVEKIYNREAKTYEKKHHLTTNYRDTWWRRQTGNDVVSHALSNNKGSIKLLDVATGWGLTLEEMFQVFKLFDLKVHAFGLDYNKEMLKHAHDVVLPRIKQQSLLKKGEREINLVWGDARNLIASNTKNSSSGFYKFSEKEFDCVTIMFGIGGIDNPIQALKEQLAVLKPGGIISLNDIHDPFFSLSEKWPFFIGKKGGAVFSYLAWEKIGKPIVLGSLWGWRNPTYIYYMFPFISIYDIDEKTYYGFNYKLMYFNTENWWLNLPLIPTVRIVAEKVEITEEEHKKRIEFLKILKNTKHVLT